MGVSENSGVFPPKSSIFIGFSIVFHYKPSILGYPYFWKRSYNYGFCVWWLSNSIHWSHFLRHILQGKQNMCGCQEIEENGALCITDACSHLPMTSCPHGHDFRIVASPECAVVPDVLWVGAISRPSNIQQLSPELVLMLLRCLLTNMQMIYSMCSTTVVAFMGNAAERRSESIRLPSPKLGSNNSYISSGASSVDSLEGRAATLCNVFPCFSLLFFSLLFPFLL